MDKFKVGEIAILNCKDYPKANGAFVEIIKIIDYYGSKAYYIHPNPSPVNAACLESGLRKIPPKQQTTTWESCVWRPEGVTS